MLETMSNCDIFHTQIASVMEVLVATAVSEMRKVAREVSAKSRLGSSDNGKETESSVIKLASMEMELNTAQFLTIMEKLAKEAMKKIVSIADESAAVLRLEVTQSRMEIEALRRKVHTMEEELKTVPGAARGRPGEDGRGNSMSFKVQLGHEFKQPESECFATLSQGRDTVEHTVLQPVLTDESVVVESDGIELIIKDELLEEESGSTVMQEGQTLSRDGPEYPDCNPAELLESHEYAEDSEVPRKCLELKDMESTAEVMIQESQMSNGAKVGGHSSTAAARRRSNRGEKLLRSMFCSRKGSVKMQSSVPVVDKSLSCAPCGRPSTVADSLRAHQGVRAGPKAHACGRGTTGFKKKRLHEERARQCTGQRASFADVLEKCSGRTSPVHEQVMPKKVKGFTCLVCGKSFGQKHSLKTHEIVHSDEKPFSCTYCGKGFTVKHSLTVHQRIHTGEKPYSCITCGKNFSQASHRKMHSRIHTGEKPFSCDVCGKGFGDTRGLKEHQVVHTGEKAFKCERCGKCFSLAVNLRRHRRIHTGEKPYSCDICGKSFSQASNVKAHKRIHSGQKLCTGQKAYIVEKPYSCGKCGKCFTHPNSLKTHQLSHTGEKPFKCTICEKSFRCVYSLKTHQRFHTGEKPYSCVKCGKSFSQTSALSSHQRVHTGEKPYSCETCGKSFSFTSSFKAHQRSHTGEKPFICAICGKSFSFLSNLKRHKRIHTGEKPFSCQICGKSFSQANNLKAHQQIHTGEKPYMCDKCGKSFAYLRNLKEHKCVYG